MSAPINQLIIDELIARLKRIQTGNGYAFDVGKVEKPDRDSGKFDPSYRDIYIEHRSDEEDRSFTCPGSPSLTGMRMLIEIVGYADPLDHDETQPGVNNESVSENVMAAMIRRAVVRDSNHSFENLWYSFGNDGNGNGLAIDAELSRSNTEDEPGWGVVVFQLSVMYRVREDDPCAVA